MAIDVKKAQLIVRKIKEWHPEAKPHGFNNDNYNYRDGDEEARFISEAFLYPLLGKEDARTLLLYFRQLSAAIDIEE